jgi:hypothetical protein
MLVAAAVQTAGAMQTDAILYTIGVMHSAGLPAALSLPDKPAPSPCGLVQPFTDSSITNSSNLLHKRIKNTSPKYSISQNRDEFLQHKTVVRQDR